MMFAPQEMKNDFSVDNLPLQGEEPQEVAVPQTDSKESLFPQQKERSSELCARTGYSLTVGPTLRKYGGPPPDNTDRPRGAEVFIGRLPRDLFEDELVPILEQYGKVWEMRILLDEKGEMGRGFAFATFYSPSVAVNVVRQLNGKSISARPQHRFALSLSKPHSLVVLRNLPKEKTRLQLQQDFGSQFEGVLNVIIWGVDAETKPARLTAFLEFGSERAAVGALNRIGSGEVMPYNYHLDAYYSYCDETNNAHTVVLHVRNLPDSASEENLAEHFRAYPSFDKARLISRFAFIHFRDHVSAERALQEQYGNDFLGQPLEMAWAKTKTYVPMPPPPRPVEGDRTGSYEAFMRPPPPPMRERERRPAYGGPPPGARRDGPPARYGSPPRGPPRYSREDYGAPPPRHDGYGVDQGSSRGGSSLLRPSYLQSRSDDYGRRGAEAYDYSSPAPRYDQYERRGQSPPRYGARRSREEDMNAPQRKRRPIPGSSAQSTEQRVPRPRADGAAGGGTSGGYQPASTGYPPASVGYSAPPVSISYPTAPANTGYPTAPANGDYSTDNFTAGYGNGWVG